MPRKTVKNNSSLESAKTSFNFNDISTDALLLILSFIEDPFDLNAFSQVCRKAYQCASQDKIWEPYGSPHWNLIPEFQGKSWKIRYLKWLHFQLSSWEGRNFASYEKNLSISTTPVITRIPQNPSSSHLLTKVYLIGDAGVGKTSLLLRYSENIFPEHHSATIGIDFKSASLQIDNVQAQIQIWDTRSQERFPTIGSSVYRGLHICFVCYDVCNMDSFLNVPKWLTNTERYAYESTYVALVGTKVDDSTNRVVTTELGVRLAADNNIMFFETSAKNDIDVAYMFETMVVNNIKNRECADYAYLDAKCPFGFPKSVPPIKGKNYQINSSKKDKKCAVQ